METVYCAATNCTHNEIGQCDRKEISLVFVEGSRNDLRCRNYENQEEGKVLV